MSQYASIAARIVLVLFPFLAGLASPLAVATDARLSETYGKLPLQFEANRGQAHSNVRFLSHGSGYSLYLTANEAVLALNKPNPDAKRDARGARAHGTPIALRMSLVGSASNPLVSGADELPGKANYFIGKDPSGWRTNIATYAKVHYRNIYRGIDLVYYGNQRQLEYDFVVAPGADPKNIVLNFKGAEKLELDAQGDLVLHAGGGSVRQHKPVIYQEVDGVRQEIAGGYVRKGANRVGFKSAAYDRSRPLVIDPVLSYSTYLGGTSTDDGWGVAVDSAGAAYVTGDTFSPDFPATSGTVATSGGVNVFVAKLNPAGTALVYSTILDVGEGKAIAVDANGNAYVTGQAAFASFPTTSGAFQTTFGGSGDAFVTKLDPTGSNLVYSTFVGGSGIDHGDGIALDAAGNAYVTGQTGSTEFPTTAGAFQTSGGGSFVLKLNPAGSALVYSTLLNAGGSVGIAVDADGNAFVAGSAFSSGLPVTAGAFQPAFGGGPSDAFVAKLDPTGSALVYSTYLGGSDADQAAGIAVDPGGNAYLAGRTLSTNFPTTLGAFQPVFAGGNAKFGGDAFIAKLDPAGAALVYSTYLGGSDGDGAFGIAVDAAGNATVVGGTRSANFPVTPDAIQSTQSGFFDVFITRLNATGSLPLYSTFLGGADNDGATGIAFDADGNGYVTGSTESPNFRTTPGAFQPNLSRDFAGGDAFIAKIGDLAPPPPVVVPPPPPSPTPTATRSEESTATQIGSWTTYDAETGTFSGGTIVASNVAASTAMFSFTGTAVSWIGVKCNVCGIAAVSIDGGVPITVNTAGPGAPGSLSSGPVFSASGLAAANHTLTIITTGMSSSGGAYVAVDAFDVTAGNATSPPLPSLVLPPPPIVIPPLPPLL